MISLGAMANDQFSKQVEAFSRAESSLRQVTVPLV